MNKILKGMTWSHPRGYSPMIECSARYKDLTGIEIVWDKRSLQDFEAYPIEELAREYDLIVIDHPHVGQVTAEQCLVPLDLTERQSEQETLKNHSVGPSYQSYYWQGHQWALPIDAAAQVQAFRPDIISNPATSWEDVLRLAQEGRVVLPLRPPHTLMCFFTIAANLGYWCNVDDGDLIGEAEGIEVYTLLSDLVQAIDPSCFTMDPIEALEVMAKAGSPIAMMPYGFGYVSYAMSGFRPNILTFADIPAVGEHGASGSVLGGTGIAVSSFSRERDAAIDYAYWVASGGIQKGPYAAAGGQPGHAEAWSDTTVNAATGDFYVNTRYTLQHAYVRPRHDGYMPFQHNASEWLIESLKLGVAPEEAVSVINRMYRRSRS